VPLLEGRGKSSIVAGMQEREKNPCSRLRVRPGKEEKEEKEKKKRVYPFTLRGKGEQDDFHLRASRRGAPSYQGKTFLSLTGEGKRVHSASAQHLGQGGLFTSVKKGSFSSSPQRKKHQDSRGKHEKGALKHLGESKRGGGYIIKYQLGGGVPRPSLSLERKEGLDGERETDSAHLFLGKKRRKGKGKKTTPTY